MKPPRGKPQGIKPVKIKVHIFLKSLKSIINITSR